MGYLIGGLVVGAALGWLLDWLLNREEVRSLREASARKDAEIERLKAAITSAEAKVPPPPAGLPPVLVEAQWCDPKTGDPVEAYCVKCRTKRRIVRPRRVSLSNGRPAIQGTCPVCRSSLFRIIKG